MRLVLWTMLSTLAACVISCIRFGVVVLADGNVGLACGYFAWMVIAVVAGECFLLLVPCAQLHLRSG